MLKEKKKTKKSNHQPRIQYSMKLSFKIKTFPQKNKKLWKLFTNRIFLQEMLKLILQRERK